MSAGLYDSEHAEEGRKCYYRDDAAHAPDDRCPNIRLTSPDGNVSRHDEVSLTHENLECGLER